MAGLGARRRADTALIDSLEFTVDATAAVVAAMTELRSHGSGWITLLPGVEEDNLPRPRLGLFSLFSGPQFHVPEATWVLPDKPSGVVQIGVRHAAGNAAATQLANQGHAIPVGWRKAMDHPRRGLVVELPHDAEDREVLDWLLGAAIILAAVPLLPEWLAEVHR